MIKKLIVILLMILMLSACQTQENEVTISFETNGGSEIEPIRGVPGDVFSLEPPIKEGYLFHGWFLDAEFLKRLEENIFPEEDITLYVKWVQNDQNIWLFTATEENNQWILKIAITGDVDYIGFDAELTYNRSDLLLVSIQNVSGSVINDQTLGSIKFNFVDEINKKTTDTTILIITFNIVSQPSEASIIFNVLEMITIDDTYQIDDVGYNVLVDFS